MPRSCRSLFSVATLRLLAAATLLAVIRGATPTDVVWYVAATNGSSDIATCGHSIDTPCENLQLIIDQSPLFDNTSTTRCHLSLGDDDGRSSTTVYFLEGVHFVPPLCLMNWTNLRIAGLGKVVITSRDSIAASRAFFEFRQCSNISIEDIESFDTSFIGKSSLFFDSTSDIRIARCTFPVVRLQSTGVIVQRTKGVVEITDSLFFGNIEPNTRESYGLSITHGCTDDGRSDDECPKFWPPVYITISNTNFTNFTTQTPPDDSYASTRSNSIGMRIRFLPGSTNSTVLIENVQSSGNVNPGGSHTLVNFDSKSSGNSVRFVNCRFEENKVRYGGGIAAYFFGGTRDNSLQIEDSWFVNNTADFEGGGIFVAYLDSPENNLVQISRNNFERNEAYSGAGVFVFNSPSFLDQAGLFDPVSLPLVTANLTNCTFMHNKATQLKEGVVTLLRMLFNITGVSRFSDNTGSAVLLRNSLLYVSGEVSFIRNKADVGAAINIQEGSRVDMSGVSRGRFLDNKAAFAGGAIYADSASTAHLASEYNHTQAQNIFGNCFVTFGNELRASLTDKTVTRFLFSGNRAVAEGHTIHSFSMRGCIASNFLPEESSRFLPIPNDGTVMIDNELVLQTTSTGPTNLFFYGASTRCYKTVGSITYLFPNCSHMLLNETVYLQTELQCGLQRMNNQLRNIYTPGTGFPPTIDKLIYPWAGIEATWTLTPDVLRQQCEEADPANLRLSPAPGEQFDLTVQLADQFLNYISNTIYMEVDHEFDQPPGVLIQLNGLQYSYIDRVYFTPNRALSGLALVGLPGTEGKLRVVSDSQVTDQKIELLIPFKLAQCPLGYYNPPGASTVEEVNHLMVTNFSVTQRIPTNQPLACHCFSSSDAPVKFSSRVLSYSHQCINGYTIELNSLLWAGLIPTATSGPSPSLYPPKVVACPRIPPNATSVASDFTSYVHSSRTRAEMAQGNSSASFDPLDVIPYADGLIPGGGAPVYCFNSTNVSELVDFRQAGEFSIEVCSRGYCRGDLRDSWFVANVDFPCVDNRQGPLCGQCKPGYAVTLYSTVCRDCSDKAYHPWLALIFTLFFGLVLVACAVALNLGVSPTLDSLLFFIQATMVILSGRTDYEDFQFLAFFNPDFTFNMCITPDLDGLSRLAFQYVTPVYILILLFFVLLLTCIKGCSKYLGRHSFLQALWLLLLISYINIAITSYELLHCRVIGPTVNGTQDLVLVHDASIMCFKGAHLPWAVISFFLVIVFVTPFPFVLIVLTYFPKFKPIIDVYCSPYKDHRRWWVLLSILRRLVLVIVGVFIQDYVSRHFGLLITVSIILLVFIVTWPYQTAIDNYFGFFVTWMVLLTTVVTQPELYLFVDPLRAISTTLVVVTIFLGILLLVFEQILKRRGMTVTEFVSDRLVPSLKDCGHLLKDSVKQIKSEDDEDARILSLEGSTHSSILPGHATLDATAYREPLLDSNLFGSSSINNGDVPYNRVPYGTRRNPILTLFGRRKSPEPVETIKEESPLGGSVPTSVVVGPDRDTGYSDSGFVHTKTVSAIDTNDTDDLNDSIVKDSRDSRATGDDIDFKPEDL